MAQHDYVIDNQSFPATRSDLNSLFQAIASCNSGATAPSTTYANQLWYDTANNKLYIRNEDNDAWIELFVLDQTGDHLEKIGDTITLDGTGNVGIGIATPDGRVHAFSGDASQTANTSANQVVAENSGNAGVSILSGNTSTGNVYFADNGDNAVGFIQYKHSDNYLRVGTAGSESLRIDSTGRLLTTTSLTSSTSYTLQLQTQAATNARVRHINFVNSNQGRGYIRSGNTDSDLPSFVAGSDYRFKTNITDYTGGYDKIKNIPVKQFDETTTGATGQIGWIAHEVAEHFPDAVEGEKDAVDGDGNPIYQGLAPLAFYPDVVQALQQAIAKIEALETRVAALEA